MDASHGFGNARFGGGNRQTRDEMQIADGGPPEVQGDADAPEALSGEGGDDIGRRSRRGGCYIAISL